MGTFNISLAKTSLLSNKYMSTYDVEWFPYCADQEMLRKQEEEYNDCPHSGTKMVGHTSYITTSSCSLVH